MNSSREGTPDDRSAVHSKCRSRLSFIGEAQCLRCGKALADPDREYCRDCSRRSFHFESNTAAFVYNETARNAMLRFKYRGRQEYAAYFAAELMRQRGDYLRALPVQLVLPVPIHVSRLRARGYNQAELLAEYLARELGLPLRRDYLLRIGKTEAQKKLDPRERIRNLAGALTVPEPDPKIACILLVDDIYTTGATLEACARVLRENGVKKVFGVTVCAGSER